MHYSRLWRLRYPRRFHLTIIGKESVGCDLFLSNIFGRRATATKARQYGIKNGFSFSLWKCGANHTMFQNVQQATIWVTYKTWLNFTFKPIRTSKCEARYSGILHPSSFNSYTAVELEFTIANQSQERTWFWNSKRRQLACRTKPVDAMVLSWLCNY